MKGNSLCNGLSITALVLSIVGFLTGWLGFGLFFDFLGVILGVIATVIGKKKNKPCGIAIAGIIVGAVGLGTMTLIFGPTSQSVPVRLIK